MKKREKGRAVVRPIRMDRFDDDLAIVKDLYNRSWEKNWGFVPMTSEEIDAMAKKLKPILYPPWVLFVELDGKPVGFHLALPDYNLVLKELGGSLLPVRVAEVPAPEEEDRPRADARARHPARVPPARLRRAPLLRGHEGRRAAEVHGAEFSWLLEDNLDIQRPLEVFGGRIYRRYRLVEKRL